MTVTLLPPAHESLADVSVFAWAGVVLFTVCAVGIIWYAVHPQHTPSTLLDRLITGGVVAGFLIILVEALHRHG